MGLYNEEPNNPLNLPLLVPSILALLQPLKFERWRGWGPPHYKRYCAACVQALACCSFTRCSDLLTPTPSQCPAASVWRHWSLSDDWLTPTSSSDCLLLLTLLLLTLFRPMINPLQLRFTVFLSRVPFFGRPLQVTVRHFVLCYGTVLSCLSVCNVGVLWPNGLMDQDVTWYRSRHRPRRLCVRW